MDKIHRLRETPVTEPHIFLTAQNEFDKTVWRTFIRYGRILYIHILPSEKDEILKMELVPQVREERDTKDKSIKWM